VIIIYAHGPRVREGHLGWLGAPVPLTARMLYEGYRREVRP
jgi:hypothetical protein